MTGFLAELLPAERDDRAACRRSERRIKAASFPREKSLRQFDSDANPNIDPAVIHTLASCERVKKGLPLCLTGDSGTGKSHLLIALGTKAATAGYRVKYVLATKLVNELVEATDEKQLTKTITRYGHVDLLATNELGYMELDRHDAEPMFQAPTEREERTASPSPPTKVLEGGPKRLPTPGSARPSSTVSPSAGTSSRPAPIPALSPRLGPGPNRPQADDHNGPFLCSFLRTVPLRSRRSSTTA